MRLDIRSVYQLMKFNMKETMSTWVRKVAEGRERIMRVKAVTTGHGHILDTDGEKQNTKCKDHLCT